MNRILQFLVGTALWHAAVVFAFSSVTEVPFTLKVVAAAMMVFLHLGFVVVVLTGAVLLVVKANKRDETTGEIIAGGTTAAVDLKARNEVHKLSARMTVVESNDFRPLAKPKRN